MPANSIRKDTEILYRRTAAERQAAYRKRQKEGKGLVQAFGWVHAHQLPALLQLIEMLKQSPGLEVGSPRNTLSGRLHKLR